MLQKTRMSHIGGVLSAALVLGLLFDFLFFEQLPGVNFFAFTVVVLGAIFALFSVLKIEYNSKILWYVPFIVFFSGMVMVRQSYFLTFLNVVATLVLFLLFIYQSVGYKLPELYVIDYVKPLVLQPFKFINRCFQGLAEILTARKLVKNTDTTKQVIRGLVFSIPLVLFFTILLSSADLAFGKFIAETFNWNIEEEIVAHVVIIVLVAGVMFGSFLYLLENTTKNTLPLHAEEKHHGSLGNIEAYIVFGLLNILFFLFIVVQMRYLFAGEAAITELGFTYAEYVHRGFAELVVVALFSLLILFGAEKFIERREGHSPVFRFLSLLLIAQVLVMLGSAFLRLLLYESAYGFTVPRFYVHAFMLWLGAVFLLLAYKIVSRAKENVFAFSVVVSVAAFLIGVNLIGPDGFIAKQNISRYKESGKLDAAYLATLSSDATPEMLGVFNAASGTTREEIGYYLNQKLKNPYPEEKTHYSSLRSFNLSHNRGLHLLEASSEELKNYISLPSEQN